MAYETREKKREALLNLAINFSGKCKDWTFDKKMRFQNILDKISEDELIYLMYKNGLILNESFLELSKNTEFWMSRDSFESSLISLGLLEQNLKEMVDKINNTSNNLGKLGPTPTGSITLNTRITRFGFEFLELILLII